MSHNRRNAVVRRNIKKIRKWEPYEWKYSNITNVLQCSSRDETLFNGGMASFNSRFWTLDSIILYPLTSDSLLYWSLLMVCFGWLGDWWSKCGNLTVIVQIWNPAVHGLSHFPNQSDQYCFLKSVHFQILYSKGIPCMY